MTYCSCWKKFSVSVMDLDMSGTNVLVKCVVVLFIFRETFNVLSLMYSISSMICAAESQSLNVLSLCCLAFPLYTSTYSPYFDVPCPLFSASEIPQMSMLCLFISIVISFAPRRYVSADDDSFSFVNSFSRYPSMCLHLSIRGCTFSSVNQRGYLTQVGS